MQNKRFLILISVVALAIIVAFGAIFYFSLKKGPGEVPVPSPRELTDFGAKPTEGIGEGSPTETEAEPETGTGGVVEVALPKLRQISTLPIAGVGVFEEQTTSTIKQTMLKFADKTTGNIYEAIIGTLEQKKVSTTEIFGVHDAVFGERGESVALRYLKEDDKTIETFLGALPKNGEGELVGSFLPENVLSLGVSPDGKNIFYLFSSGDGVVGINSLIDGSKKSQVFDSAFSEWAADWPNQRLISLLSKPSSRVLGYLYSLDPQNGSFEKILSGISGLTAKLSPDGKAVLYADNGLGLKIYDIKNKTSAGLGVKTLPEKCVWGKNNVSLYCAVPQFLPEGEYPDSWYQGLISFSDSIWKIDAGSNTTTLLANPSASFGNNIDAIKLQLSPDGNYLFFINKKDSTLWGLGLI